MATPRKKAKPAAAPKAAGTRKRRGVKLKPTDLVPSDTPIPVPEGELADLANLVQRDGGAVLASYREPLGGHALLFVRAAGREGRADAVPARGVRRARAQAHRGDGQDQALPRSDHRRCAATTEATSRPTATIASPR